VAYPDKIQYSLAAGILVSALVCAPQLVLSAECPAARKSNLLQPTLPLNLDKIKQQLRLYHNETYDVDIEAVFSDAQAYVDQRADQVRNPALVLDIDETSLSNWPNLSANDFGFIPSGACDRLPNGPCGFKAWMLQAIHPVITPALNLFNAAKAKGVAVFFISGRRDSERQATLWNLDRAGFEGGKLITRADDDRQPTNQAFKIEQRRRIAEDGYTIIANVSSQDSALAGGYAECKFKVPNPFYFLPGENQ
jgi:hypothetical protein